MKKAPEAAPAVTGEPQEDIQEEVPVLEVDEHVESFMHTVAIGTYGELMAKIILADMKNKGFEGVMVPEGEMFLVHAGVFSQKQNAINMKFKLESFGYKPVIQ